MLAFDLSFRYRNPVVVLADGYLGQMTGKVELPRDDGEAGAARTGRCGATPAHRAQPDRPRSACCEADLEAHNLHLNEKYAAHRARASSAPTSTAATTPTCCSSPANTPARMAKGAVRGAARRGACKAGLFRPVTLWPFPIRAPAAAARAARGGSWWWRRAPGQLEDELRLALSHAGVAAAGHRAACGATGGVLPQPQEIVETVVGGAAMAEGVTA